MVTKVEAVGGSRGEVEASGLLSGHRLEVALGVLAFVLATALGAYVRIPLPLNPVPMTLQPLFVLLAGALLGPVAGASSMLVYLGVGASGLPVFSGGGAGIGWLLGPTGGYLLAYPVAAFVTGTVVGSARAWLRVAAGCLAGIVVIYAGGLVQLQLLTGQEFSEVLGLAVFPFVGGDLVKIGIAILVVRAFRGHSRESDPPAGAA